MSCLTGSLSNYHTHCCPRCRRDFACTLERRGSCKLRVCEVCKERLKKQVDKRV